MLEFKEFITSMEIIVLSHKCLDMPLGKLTFSCLQKQLWAETHFDVSIGNNVTTWVYHMLIHILLIQPWLLLRKKETKG